LLTKAAGLRITQPVTFKPLAPVGRGGDDGLWGHVPVLSRQAVRGVDAGRSGGQPIHLVRAIRDEVRLRAVSLLATLTVQPG